MLAKALALAAVAAIAGAAATITVTLASQVILVPGHYPAPLSQPGGPRAAVAFTLLMPLAAVTGLALGALLRRPVTAVAAVVIVLNLLPGLAVRPAPDGLRCLVRPCQPAGSRQASFRRSVVACPLQVADDRVHARHCVRPAARHVI
jgi:hypothetical protein